MLEDVDSTLQILDKLLPHIHLCGIHYYKKKMLQCPEDTDHHQLYLYCK